MCPGIEQKGCTVCNFLTEGILEGSDFTTLALIALALRESQNLASDPGGDLKLTSEGSSPRICVHLVGWELCVLVVQFVSCSAFQ